ncbi:anti-repressor protein [Lachnotalea glycerini]|uniref:Anti-repressor protein n=1 Tax=Lachnotalea glycerini TaxID=1763509 RepID=A0A318EM65_9FIRM|nr:antA/AntB antirepressor family protein [Lachnotalea glycerini]PXV88378.1 anti-repressor protein [Lachnotalea glycerini]
MNQFELINKKGLTPIEITLQIDENGMTTARKLYEFLELAKGQFSRWCNSNILTNSFADENKDYIGFDINVEGNDTKDYKLTADFAKKLAMASKSEKGEQARNYFIKVENKLKDLTKPHCIEDVLIESLQEMKAMKEQFAKHDKEITSVKDRVESIREVVALDTTSWREDTSNILKKIGHSLGGGQIYSQVRAESYELLEKRMGVSLATRLTNKRRRMADEGICKSKRDKLSYVDIIAEDKKLIEGYMAIVKEMAIRYGAA